MNIKNIEDTLKNLKDEFVFKKEEGMAGFLRIQIELDKATDKNTLTKTGLIDRILLATNMQDSNLK